MNWYMNEVFTIYVLAAFVVALFSKGVIPGVFAAWLLFGLLFIRLILFLFFMVTFLNRHDRNS
jgi:hypothetical protein